MPKLFPLPFGEMSILRKIKVNIYVKNAQKRKKLVNDGLRKQ
jgi:hypothetical protein